MANTWGESGTTWGQNTWGQQSDVTLTLTGLSATTTLGTPTVSYYPGWGTLEWGYNGWGTVGEATETLTGLSATLSVGAITPADVVGVSGYSITGSLGAPTINYDFKVTLTDSLLGTLSLGSLTTIPDMVIGVSGYAITASLGTITEEVITFPTGYEATMSLGTVAITSNPLVVITATNLVTGSLGSVTVTDMSIGVSGYSITGSLGTTTVTDMAIGVSGLSATLSLGSVSPLGYKDVDITGNTAYSNVDITGNTSYTDVTHSG